MKTYPSIGRGACYGKLCHIIQLKIRNTKIKKGLVASDSEELPFSRYKRLCRNYSKKFIKLLYESWNGYDFYDKEYIKENLKITI